MVFAASAQTGTLMALSSGTFSAVVSGTIKGIQTKDFDEAMKAAVYDMTDPKRTAPWAGKLSKVVTSCANLYTTNDGQDLLFEIVSILCYASSAGVKVSIQQ